MIPGAVQEQGHTPKSHGTVECVFVLLYCIGWMCDIAVLLGLVGPRPPRNLHIESKASLLHHKLIKAEIYEVLIGEEGNLRAYLCQGQGVVHQREKLLAVAIRHPMCR